MYNNHFYFLTNDDDGGVYTSDIHDVTTSVVYRYTYSLPTHKPVYNIVSQYLSHARERNFFIFFISLVNAQQRLNKSYAQQQRVVKFPSCYIL